MPDDTHPHRPVTLSLPPEEAWTLHHVLLDRIEREAASEPAAGSPPVEVFRAFETLDAGGRRFTVAQLEAMQGVLAEYHHATTWWEIERARIERLLDRITDRLDRHGTEPGGAFH